MKKTILFISTLVTLSSALADIPDNSICKKNSSGKLECVKVNPTNVTINGNNNIKEDLTSKSSANPSIIEPIKSIDNKEEKKQTSKDNEHIQLGESNVSSSNSDNNANTNSIIYRYVDAQGGVHYTDNLPKDKKIKATILKQN